MSLDPAELWQWNGATRRGVYLGWGVGLMAVKYNLDRLIASSFGVNNWNWTSYWHVSDIPLALTPERLRLLYLTLLAVALPFIFAGVVLTVRRLRDASAPRWLAALFFVPAVNVVFFFWLCAMPSRPEVYVPPPRDAQRVWLAFAGKRASAVAGVGLTVVLAVPLIAFGTLVLETYGWGLFVGLPFFMGLVSALIHSASEYRSLKSCCAVAALSVLFAGLALLAFAVEGVVCVLMAAPLAVPLAILGGLVAYWIQYSRWTPRATGQFYGGAWLLLPALLYGESRIAPRPPLIPVTTQIVINASPQTVWRHVVTFAELPPPQDLIFSSGIAYPVRARIWGHGVGAVRHCEFSTGPFVEPITVWDEPHRLAFDVTRQPPPLRELSPYANLTPPHLDGFFRSRRGEFRLIARPNGGTQLDGTTWYEQNLWPGRYWRLWSDYLVHQIHLRVLQQIKAEAEAEQSRA